MKKLLFFVLILPLFTYAQPLKNLDIKNGFLQFHLGDSLSNYKNDIYIALDRHPDQNEVKKSAMKLSKYFDKVTLISEHGIVTEIEIFLRDEGSIQYIDGLLEQAYGKGHEIPNLDANQPGTHLVCTTWTGERLTMLMLQNNLNELVNGHMTRGRIQSIIFKKTSDVKVEGDLPVGFAL